MWRNWSPGSLLVAVVGNSMVSPQNAKHGITMWSSNSTLKYTPKRIKVVTPIDTSIPRFIVALFTITKRWKQPKCPSTDSWIHRMCSIHTVESYSALKRKAILTPATMWTNLENMKYASWKRTCQRLHSKAAGSACVRFPVGRGCFPRFQRQWPWEAIDAERMVTFSAGYYPVWHQLYKGCRGAETWAFLCPWSHQQHCVWKSTSPVASSYTAVFLIMAVASCSHCGPGCWSFYGHWRPGWSLPFSPPKQICCTDSSFSCKKP